MADVLDRFSPATRAWFEGTFSAPTPAQAGSWEAISSGQHTLVVAPTGSGKTLSAFLWSLDRLAAEGVPEDPQQRCRILYISPMKALAVDVERNLRSPLVGITHAATRLGEPEPDITVAVRSGDTTAQDRRVFAKAPADVLITTPESLFLLLTSAARESLRGVQTVIIDEIHAVAGTKRGAHLALSLERLDELLQTPAQRVGLSATVRPVEEVARYLAGGRPVSIVQPPIEKSWDLEVVVPVPDMSELGQVTGDLSGAAAGPVERTSIWPHVEERIVDLVAEHRSTLIFANSRRLAERLTARLNEIWSERLDPVATQEISAPPAQVMAQAGATKGAPPVLARAHHGSVSKEQRGEIEDALKRGDLPAVVATSSLELGIDMGAVDLVIQVESPPSVASGLQRVGRAGHQVGATSHGVLFPKFRGDLLQTTVVAQRMRTGQIEALHVPANPLDVLAQQIVAMCAMDDWLVDDLERVVRRTASFATLARPLLESVLDMLSGRYPSDEFAELRARLVWDRISGTLTGRRGAQRLAVTSGGTIPDRGLYGVFLASGTGPGRRVGELDEEMVYESRVGDVFTLGTSSWRIEDITHDQVLVSPAPGQPGKLPFWKGDTLGRPAELGRAVGEFVRSVGAQEDATAREELRVAGLDDWASDNLLGYLREQQDATGQLPTDRQIVVERFRDELGDWRIVIHSPYGAQIHAPWALAISARLREQFGLEVQAMHGDDGIVLRMLDFEIEDGDQPVGQRLLDAIILDPDEVAELVTREIGGSALFASRFRECAARALLIPRRQPGRRQALWQQRQRSAQLLEVAARYPSFPIILEAVRECVQDVFDVPALTGLMRDIGSRTVRVVQVDTPSASPFARSLLFGYVAQFLYEGDSPLAERRAAALAMDPSLLADLLGHGEGAALRDLLDPQVVDATEQELQRLTPERAARDAEDVVDLLRALGPLPADQIAVRTVIDARDQVPQWLAHLEQTRQVFQARWGGVDHFAAIEDAGRLRDALGVGLPPGIATAFTDSVPDPLGDLLARYARTHGPFGIDDIAQHFGLGRAVAATGCRRLVTDGRLVEGELRPDGATGGLDLCDPQVLRLLRRRSLASLRAEVEPVPAQDFARFLPAWQAVGSGQRGMDGLFRAVEQLAGARLPASALETLVLPARVAGYTPALLDEAMSSGEVLWQGHAALPGDDGWVSLHLADAAPLTLLVGEGAADSPLHEAVRGALTGGGAFFFRPLLDAVRRAGQEKVSEKELVAALWDLVWAGEVSGDTIAALRARLGGGRPAHRSRSRGPRRARYGRPGGISLGSGLSGGGATPADAAGRWTLLPQPDSNVTARALARAEVLLDRYGVVTRGSVTAEGVDGGFAGVYRVLAAAEEAGRVRRGYFIEGLGAAQFASGGAVDRLRASSKPIGTSRNPWDGPAPVDQGRTLVLAAADPANPYGAALPWPDRELDPAVGDLGKTPRSGHKPGRKAGALVVLVDGALVLYVERGGRTLLSYSADPVDLRAAADALALAVREGALGALTVRSADGDPVLGSDQPLAAALAEAGFHVTPRGLRIRT
ncbi:Lhr family ATP dependent helicase [Branchiibius hedensis]|uniref:ATP dependent helicase, Lhr family n=1 Tax=Branchiibius hedensis TaxID=672460 RepID=A0A2Y9C112_9MICO|nr:ATP-dependent helicase [Branchiibius hedensis]PWJ24656.1 Lhr family ATP dependent helicase [Branchiibius hedensis]SSA33473.1 ATP dependent helicase, Lhr family [Branchiibius hedensis]